MHTSTIKVGYVPTASTKRSFVPRSFVPGSFVLVGKKGPGNEISVVVVPLYNIKSL